MGGYSLAESESKGVLFIHVPKNGGTSINHALFGTKGAGHLAYYFMELIYSPSELSQLYKFAFVRNPWSRLYSTYTYLMKGGGNDWDKKWAESNISEYKDFESFVMGWLNEESIHSYVHFLPQSQYICDAWGKVKLDFIGRFEQFEDDFATLTINCGLKASLSHLNASPDNVGYREAYTKEMKDKVGRVYSQDIDLFSYDF